MVSILSLGKAQVKVFCVEKDNIEKGIVNFISEHRIKKLVIEAAACRHYSRGITEVKSKKAMYVCEQAPPFY
nr:U-box domain-containing protein 33-like [Ipomoea batatas]